MPEYDDDEDLPGAERGSGLGVGARGANSEVDALYEVDAVYGTSSRSHGADCEVDALYETSIRITAAALCGCCRTHLSFILSIYLLSCFTYGIKYKLQFVSLLST